MKKLSTRLERLVWIGICALQAIWIVHLHLTTYSMHADSSPANSTPGVSPPPKIVTNVRNEDIPERQKQSHQESASTLLYTWQGELLAPLPESITLPKSTLNNLSGLVFRPRSGKLNAGFGYSIGLRDEDISDINAVFSNVLNKIKDNEVKTASFREDETGNEYLFIGQNTGFAKHLAKDTYNELSDSYGPNIASILIAGFVQEPYFGRLGSQDQHLSFVERTNPDGAKRWIFEHQFHFSDPTGNRINNSLGSSGMDEIFKERYSRIFNLENTK